MVILIHHVHLLLNLGKIQQNWIIHEKLFIRAFMNIFAKIMLVYTILQCIDYHGHDRGLPDLPVLTWKLQAQNMLCSYIVLNVKTKKQCMYTTCSDF